MNKKIYFHIVLLAFIGLSVFSCKRQEPTSWNTDALGPLVSGRITLQNILGDSLLQADGDDLWHLILHENLTDFSLDSLVALPDTVIRKEFEVPILGGPFTIPGGQVIIEEEEDNLLNINGAELREVILESGFLEYSIRSYINGYLQCDYEIPGVTLGGVGTLIQNTTQPGSVASPYIFSGAIDLSEHHIDLTGQSGFTFNRIYSHLTIASALGGATPTLVSAHDSVVIELKFVDPRVRYARGYFGQHEYVLDETLDFGDDISFPTGSLNLDAVNMQMHINNAVGADTRLDFSSLSNYNAYNDSHVALAYDPIFQPINITRAFDNGGTVTPTVYDFDLNNANSNIDAFIENLPNNITLQANVSVNPLGDVTDGNDFIYLHNALRATLDIDIPLTIGAQDLTFTDTLAIAAALDVNASGNLFLYVENAFPFTALCNAYILGADGEILSVIVNAQQISSALDSGTSGITIPVQSILTIPVTPEIIEHFNPENKILLRVKFDTQSLDSPTGLYTNYYMDFKIIADGQVMVSYE